MGVASGRTFGTGVGAVVVHLVTVRLADWLALPTMAEMATTVFAVTVDVVTGKLAEVWPAGTVTTPGGLATRLLVEGAAPRTLVGLSVMPCRIG